VADGISEVKPAKENWGASLYRPGMCKIVSTAAYRSKIIAKRGEGPGKRPGWGPIGTTFKTSLDNLRRIKERDQQGDPREGAVPFLTTGGKKPRAESHSTEASGTAYKDRRWKGEVGMVVPRTSTGERFFRRWHAP